MSDIQIWTVSRAVLAAAMLRRIGKESPGKFKREMKMLEKTEKGRQIIEMVNHPENWVITEV